MDTIYRTCILFFSLVFGASAAAAAPVVTPGFTLSVFATPPAGSSKPDSIAVVDGRVWIGYGDGHAPDGSDGLSNEIVEYTADGDVMRTISVKGHNDGLRLNPYTHRLWAIQNEDANPTLVVIDPDTGQTQLYSFPPTLHGGGYDDVTFIDGHAYISASNPTLDAQGLNSGPSIVRAVLNSDFTISVTPVLAGHFEATQLPEDKSDHGSATKASEQVFNLTDPDSITATPEGDILMTDQADAQLVILRPKRESRVWVLPLLGGVQVDDTTFVNSIHGYLLISDTAGNTVYKLTAKAWTPGSAFSASTGVPAAGQTPAIPGYVGELDTGSGAVLPAVTDLMAPHGVVFVGVHDDDTD